MKDSVLASILAAATFKDRGTPRDRILPRYVYRDECRQAEMDFSNLAETAEKGLQDRILDLNAACCTAHETQGFVNGMRYGVMLAAELQDILKEDHDERA